MWFCEIIGKVGCSDWPFTQPMRDNDEKRWTDLEPFMKRDVGARLRRRD